MRCKTCGAELLEVGHPRDFYQKYRCPNGCKEIFGLGVKVRSFLSGIAVAAVYITVLLFLTPVLLAAALLSRKEKIKNKKEV